MKINLSLKKYIEDNILPIYQKLDLAHSGNHVFDVINKSLSIAKDYDVNLDMIYTIAAFHDVGLIKDRKTHHIIGGKMLAEDEFIQNIFTKAEIKIMQEAVEDHRASNKTAPRSIYGKIVGEADRAENMDKIIERCLLFQMKSDEDTFDEIYPSVYDHIVTKYGENGYLTVWLKTVYVEEMLSDIRKLLKDSIKFKQYTKNIFNKMKFE